MCRLCICLTFMIASVLAADACEGVLLIPDSGNDKVWAFDPFDGALVNDNFIPNDGRMATPLTPVYSGHGTILLSDQIADAVFEYGYDGVYIRTIADRINNGIDNVRGLTVFNDQIYVCVDAGSLADTVQRFNMDGSGQATWASGIGSPWFVQFRDNDALVSNSTGDRIERFDHGGNPLSPFHDSDGVNGIDFPQQLYLADDGGDLGDGGHVFAAGFSTPAGLYEYDELGVELNYFDVDVSARGVWMLGNGKLLFTGGTRVGTYDMTTGDISAIVDQDGASFRHIGHIPIPEPAGLFLLATATLIALRRR